MPATSSCPTATLLDHLGRLDPDHLGDLRRYLAVVPDPRDPRGIRHGLASILALAAMAVAAGARSLTAIAEWATDAPQHVLTTLGVRHCPRRNRHVVPDEATIRRVLGALDGDALDTAISAWITATTPTTTPPVIAVDGKSVRGTFARTGGAGVHLLSALTHQTGLVLASTWYPRAPARSPSSSPCCRTSH